jgi:thiol-disulfide isomerase/thioredoxin
MATITLYYWDQCGYCVAFKPVWEELKNKFQKDHIKFYEYESNKDREIIDKAEIDSYPTIKIKSDAKEYNYFGNRSLEDLSNKIIAAINESKEDSPKEKQNNVVYVKKNIQRSELKNGENIRDIIKNDGMRKNLKHKYLKYKSKYLNEKMIRDIKRV